MAQQIITPTGDKDLTSTWGRLHRITNPGEDHTIVWPALDDGWNNFDGLYTYYAWVDDLRNYAEVQFYIDPLDVIPNTGVGDSVVRLRTTEAQLDDDENNDVVSPTKCSVFLFDNNGQTIAHTDIYIPGSPPSGTAFYELSGVMDVPEYASYTPNYSNSYLQIQIEPSDSTAGYYFDTSRPKFDAIEIELNGQSIDSNNVTLYIAGTEPTGINTDITLYMDGEATKVTESIDLFLKNTKEPGRLDLFIHGKDQHTEETTLYTQGGVSKTKIDDFTLYLEGHQDINDSGTPLYIAGGLADEEMNLFVKGFGGTVSGDIGLYMWSTTNSGVYTNMPMYLKAQEPSGTETAEMNLFLKGLQYGEDTANMNLFLKNAYPSTNNSIDMFIQNEWESVDDSGTTLFIKSQDGTEGWGWKKNDMDLYIARGNDSVSDDLTLYMPGPTQDTDEVTLFLEGMPNINTNTDLTIIGSEQSTDDDLELYTHGF